MSIVQNYLRVVRPTREWVYLVSTDPTLAVPFDAGVVEVPGVSRPTPREMRFARTTLVVPEVARFLASCGVDTREEPATALPAAVDTLGLYAHQREAVARICERGCLLLADAMGLGKTRSAAVAAAVRQHNDGTGRPILILAPKFLATSWRRELERIGLVRRPEQFVALRGSSPEKSKLVFTKHLRWIFVHYEIVHGWWSWLQLWRPIATILDEAHFVKNARSQRGKAAHLVTSAAPMRIILTGTPVLNRVDELHSLLSLVTGPWTWGSWRAFRDRYVWNDGFGAGARNAAELQARIAPYYVRRTLVDAGISLPPLRRELIHVDLEEASRAAYTKALSGLDPGELARAILGKRAGQRTIEFLTKLRKITARAKVEATIEHARSIIEQSEPVVVFTWEKAIATQIAHALMDVGLVHGDIAQRKRDEMVESFQRGAAYAGGLVATYGALGVGVTLTKARYVIMHDLDYVPATLLQAEARVHRISQSLPTTSFWMVASDTIDSVMATLLDRKGADIGAAVGDTAPRELADLLSAAEVDSVNTSIERLVAWATGGA